MNSQTILDDNIQDLVKAASEKYQLGQLDDAQALYHQVLEIQPDHVVAQGCLGNIFLLQNRLDEAIAAYQKVLKLNPIDTIAALALKDLGNAFYKQGKLNKSIEFYQQGVKIQPDAATYYSLGNAFLQQKKLNEAVESYQECLKYQPNFADAYIYLGKALREQLKLDEAINAYQKALKLRPDCFELYCELGNTLFDKGKLEDAITAYQESLKLQPDFAIAEFGIMVCQLPIIYSQVEEIKLKRDNYQKYLQNLAQRYRNIPDNERKKAEIAVGSIQPFYLTYQGLNDRDLQQIYGEMISQIMTSSYPQWSLPLEVPKLAAGEKIRVGFISRFFYEHSNWKIPLKGWVENLDRTEFELFGYHTVSKRDQETVISAKVFDKFTQGDLSFTEWCELISQDKLHVLIFPEFGMDPMTVKLGCLRLAPIQITSWGHPETSGLPTIDYYLSSDLMEPDNAQEYYTEKLIKLPNLSIHYTPLEVQTAVKNKQEIGIKDTEIMFWCCQSLYKYLPSHDDVFPRIAKNLTAAKFVFIQNESEEVTKIFQRRLELAFEEFELNYQEYCIFLPRMSTSTFAATAAIADVFLDSIGWSGCNSTLESIAHNIPVLTLPGEMMRGRHTLAILKMMGIEETIAANKDEYVEIAVRLGKDAEYRQYISQQIAQNKHKLYGDLKPVRALEDFLLKVVNKPRRFNNQQLAEIFQLAVEHQKAQRLGDAEKLYHQVLEEYPDHPEALYNLGMLAQQVGQLQIAEQYLNAASQVQPDSVKTWFSLGNLRLAQEQFSQAVIAYRQALAIRTDAVPIYNNLGYALQQQGIFDEAINFYKKALELKPNFIEAEANLGNTLHAQGKLSSEQQLHYAQLNYKLGVGRKKAGDFKTAATYYRQAIALQPDLADAHYNLGVVLQEEGELEEAIACYQKALELNPNFGDVYFSLGKIYQAQNNLEQAISAYRQGLISINPHYAQAVAAYQDCETKAATTPPISQTEVTISGYPFPTIPPVADDTVNRPFWSVVMPIYSKNQRHNYLLECLVNVLRQWTGEGEMEIVIVDDASPVPVLDLVREIGVGIIQYYRNSQNRGAYRNFNTAVAISKGQWIHLLHDDDYVLPGFYERLRESLEACPPAVGAAFTGYENIDEQGKVVFSKQVYGQNKGIAKDFIQHIGVVNPLNMPAVVVRRSTYEHLGGYLPELNYTGDWEFYKRVTAFYDWWYEPEILAHYRQHGDNITTDSLFSGSKGTDLRRAIEVSENYLPSEIAAKSRHYHFAYCLGDAVIALKYGKIAGALRLLQEALKIESSPESVAKLFAWLTQDEASGLRDEIASKVFLEVAEI